MPPTCWPRPRSCARPETSLEDKSHVGLVFPYVSAILLLMTNTARTFLVGLQGENGINPHVLIREVQPGSSAFPLSREDAWTLARKIAQPLNVRGGRKHGLL